MNPEVLRLIADAHANPSEVTPRQRDEPATLWQARAARTALLNAGYAIVSIDRLLTL